MKKNALAAMMVLLVCAAVFAFSQTKRTTAHVSLQRWEYMEAHNASFDALDNLGKEGWELIQVLPDKAGDRDDTIGGTYIFKRPK